VISLPRVVVVVEGRVFAALSAARNRSVRASRRELVGVRSPEPYRRGTLLEEGRAERAERVGARSIVPLRRATSPAEVTVDREEELLPV